MKTKPEPGARVRYRAAFLRSTGVYVGDAPRAVFEVAPCDCGLCGLGRHVAVAGGVLFDTREPDRGLFGDAEAGSELQHIHFGNLERAP